MPVFIWHLTSLVWGFLAFSSPVEGAEPPRLVVLGIAQDGSYPHAGCKRACCQAAWKEPSLARKVTCVAVVDPGTKQRWLFECTPDFTAQLQALDELFPVESKPGITGILLTHAHIGHYAGLVQLGREVMGARQIPVYAMPRMHKFLSENGPWSQLVALDNIRLKPLQANTKTKLNANLAVTPILVPHRDEFSETVGFIIDGPNRSVLFLPDIDKWTAWERRIEEVVSLVDVAYVDGTFFANGEIPGRDMSEIPHPFIRESLKRFSQLSASERKKLQFIHLNHTNPALRAGLAARQEIEAAGHGVADEGDIFEL
jgi:pyrroloquinoline quinone biosynthesis protein B